MTDLLVVLAVLSVLAAIILPVLIRARDQSRLAQCKSNLQQVGRAVLLYAEDHKKTLPELKQNRPPGGWWWYKDQVKSYAGLKGKSSSDDKVFACPNDRGYGEAGGKPVPFRASAKYGFTSYVFNGVNLPGMPNIAGWDLTAVREPARTLLVMEWTAHAPLSWHRSRTGKANAPFYTDAESVVTFVDGRVDFIKIYYDGINPAFTRDPIGGYTYRYSGE
jgi:type II secretory pathway pseudopilin PulG